MVNGEMKETKSCKICKNTFEDYISNQRSTYCSLPCYWESKKKKYGFKGYWFGKKRDEQTKKKMSENRKGITAKDKHPNWKGGISSINSSIRSSFDYKQWRKEVFKRDRWTCVLCGYRSVGKIGRFSDIEADHIKQFKDFPELRFSTDNGRTLCTTCHKKITFKHDI